MTQVTQRSQTEAPTEPGWYYAQIVTQAGPIGPVHVLRAETGVVYVTGKFRNFHLRDFRWFGPVATVVEKTQ